jgi:hypothetical protein
MRNILRAVLLLLLATTLIGQPNPWKRYRNVDGNFTVLFPGEPTDTVNKTGNESQSHNLKVQTASGLYLVVYVTNPTEQPVDEATFQVYRNAFLEGLPQCTMDAEKAANPALGALIGRWYRLSCKQADTKVVMEGNLYWGKHYAYAVLVMHPSAAAHPDGEQNFLDSFSMIDTRQ